MAKAAQVALEEAEAPLEELPPPTASRRKLVLIAAAALLLTGAIGGGAWYLVKSAIDGDASETPAKESKVPAKVKAKVKEKEKDRKPSVFMNLETFTRQPSDRRRRSFSANDDRIRGDQR